MRRYLLLSPILFAAACAPRPQVTTAPVPTPPPPQVGQSPLQGLNVQELVAQFGKPALQVHEGSSMKLQFRGALCVLDAYLYPSSRDGQLRVTYVDTRRPSGEDTNQAACIVALKSAS
jgi:hypothetical protein